MRHALKTLYRHQFFSLSAGVAAANVLSLVAMPFLAGIYGAESFGAFGVFFAITTIMGTFTTLRLDQAVPIAENDGERTALSQIAFMSSLTLCTAFSVMWIAFDCGALLSVPTDRVFPITAAFASILVALLNIQTTIAIKYGNLRSISLRYFTEKVTTLLAAFLIFRKTPIYGLIFSQIMGYAASALTLTIGTGNRLFRRTDWKNFPPLAMLYKYRDFPLHNGLSNLFQILQMQAPALIFSTLFPLSMLGYYNLAQRIIEAPNAIVGSALGTVFYRRMLHAQKTELSRIYRRTMLWAGIVVLLPMLLVAIFSVPIVRAVFGKEWTPAAIFFVLLLPAASMRMLYFVAQNCFIILRRLDFGMKILASSLVATLLGVGIGSWRFSSMEVAVFIASAGAAVILLIGLWTIDVELRTVGKV